MMMSKAQHDAKYNTPERMLERRSRLVYPRTASNMTVRLTGYELEYLEWLVAERKRRQEPLHEVAAAGR